MHHIRRWLVVAHRYAGIALCLVFLVGFVSGIGMVFAGGMPRVSAADRLAHLAPLDLSRVRLNVADAAARAEIVEILIGKNCRRAGDDGGVTA